MNLSLGMQIGACFIVSAVLLGNFIQVDGSNFIDVDGSNFITVE